MRLPVTHLGIFVGTHLDRCLVGCLDVWLHVWLDVWVNVWVFGCYSLG